MSNQSSIYEPTTHTPEEFLDALEEQNKHSEHQMHIYDKYLCKLRDAYHAGKIDSEELQLKMMCINVLRTNDSTANTASNYLEVLTAMSLKTMHARLKSIIDGGMYGSDIFTNPKRRSLSYDLFSQVIGSVVSDVLVVQNDRCYVVDENRYYDVGLFNSRQFASFIFDLFNDITSNTRYMSTSDIRKLSILFEDKLTKTLDSSNNIIQFNDCYLENAQLFKGRSSTFPRYFIDRSVYPAYERFKQTGAGPTMTPGGRNVEDLILHLCNYDSQTKHRFDADISMIFCNHPGSRSNFARLIKLFGPSGANGKSLFHSILSNAIGSRNTSSFFARDFNDQFRVGMVARSLVSLEAEDSGKISLSAAQTIKSLVTSDPMSVRDIRSSPEVVCPITTLFSNTNVMTKTNDKTDAFSRRLDWFKVNERLHRTEDWFKTLRSDEAAQYLCEIILINMFRTLEAGTLPIESDMMKRTRSQFMEDNNSSIDYFDQLHADEVIGMPIKEVREAYSKWCSDNDQVEYFEVFERTLQSKYGVAKHYLGKLTVNPESIDYSLICQSKANLRLGWLPDPKPYEIDYTVKGKDGHVIFSFYDDENGNKVDEFAAGRVTSIEEFLATKPVYANDASKDRACDIKEKGTSNK